MPKLSRNRKSVAEFGSAADLPTASAVLRSYRPGIRPAVPPRMRDCGQDRFATTAEPAVSQSHTVATRRGSSASNGQPEVRAAMENPVTPRLFSTTSPHGILVMVSECETRVRFRTARPE